MLAGTLSRSYEIWIQTRARRLIFLKGVFSKGSVFWTFSSFSLPILDFGFKTTRARKVQRDFDHGLQILEMLDSPENLVSERPLACPFPESSLGKAKVRHPSIFNIAARHRATLKNLCTQKCHRVMLQCSYAFSATQVTCCGCLHQANKSQLSSAVIPSLFRLLLYWSVLVPSDQ